jgi:transposase
MEIIAMTKPKTKQKSRSSLASAAAASTQPAAQQAPASRPPSSEQPRFVGVDLHKEIAVYHTISHDGSSICKGRFDVTPGAIRDFAAEHLLPGDQLAVEATSNTWAFVRLVRPYVAEVTVSNPLKTKAIAEANIKTDKVDAFVLAQLLRCGYLPGVWQAPPAIEQSRALAARRTALVNQRTGARNRVHAVLAQRLVRVGHADLFSDNGLAWLRAADLDPLARQLVDSDLRLLEALARESEKIDEMIIQESFADPDIQLLMTLPGCDYTVAHALKATLADIERFPSPDKAASYLGLVPSVKQSAGKCYVGSITKAGSTQARWLLVQAAQSVGRHPGPLGAFFRKLARRKNRNVAVVATARKMVTIAWHMLKNKEPYRYAVPRSTDEKLASLRVRATGVRRKTGPAKGSPRGSKLASERSRTVKALDEVFARQGLPKRRPLTEGEKRMIRQSGTADFVASLDAEHVVPRNRKAGKPNSSRSAVGTPRRSHHGRGLSGAGVTT